MVLLDTETGEKPEAIIEKMTAEDFKVIKKEKTRFDKKFNWPAYKKQEVYKIRLKDNETILGLMCIKDHTDASINAIQIELLEVSAENIGKKKKIDRIGGCLVAWACRESYARGHEGVVFLVPKTGLVEHYSDHYGFVHWPMKTADRPEGIMWLEDPQSNELVKEFIDHGYIYLSLNKL